MNKKILYVEDDLDAEFIIHIFGSLLSAHEINALEDSENDDEAIIDALRSNKRIDICPCFTDVIYKLDNHQDEYELLIVDRDLWGDGTRYKRSEVPASLSPAFEEEFIGREGDFLIFYMVGKRFDIERSFFVLTGHHNPIQEIEGFKYILTPNFKRNNIILKPDTKGRIKAVIENTSYRLNINYLNILDENIDDGSQSANHFLKLIKEIDQIDRIGDNLSKIRIIYESILNESYRRLPIRQDNLLKGHMKVRQLESAGHLNTIQTHFFYSIYNICSRFGSHQDAESEIYSPSLDTVNSLFFALKDTILWFGKFCEANPRQKP